MRTRNYSPEIARKLIRCAKGELPCDLVLKNGKIINVFTGEILDGDLGICAGYIAGIGTYRGIREKDLKGRYLSPGLIDGHIHIESSMLEPLQFARSVVPHGTTAVICDPHEIANVSGLEGVRYLLESAGNLSLDIFAMAPSCVPATEMETAGAKLDATEVAKLLDHPKILGLAEMMNFPGTIFADPDILEKIKLTQQRGLLVDGHAPGLRGKDLQAYCAAGISSDHECTTLEEAQEKIRSGMYIYIREGSTAKNLAELIPLVNPATAPFCLLVSDDLHPDDLLQTGHLDNILKKAVRLGLDPVTAIQLVTINPARRFGLDDIGAIAPGYRANLVTFDDLTDFRVKDVLVDGMLCAEAGKLNGETVEERQDQAVPLAVKNSIRVKWSDVDFSLPVRGSKVRVIELVENQLITKSQSLKPTIKNNFAVADPSRDLLKIAVIERHKASGRMQVGFVRGFGLQRGAFASTIAHDSHNIIVVGVSDEEMLLAAQSVAEINGGLAIVTGKDLVASLSLPIGGLMSTASVQEVAEQLNTLRKKVKSLGCHLDNPFMALSFLALPVIPELKLTDRGLVDVKGFHFTPLWM